MEACIDYIWEAFQTAYEKKRKKEKITSHIRLAILTSKLLLL